ncbi:SNF2 family N-terminal domain-domain-containing protein [Absidia repens]|uniref:DNA helicase n=1 Tax=Absidia repens TaxID=90262 RepID=A0A1X2ILA5_9FUNG|nr:SNF2 family N-terminal domain-domain-containing protein [Absidia repens]
MDDLENKLKQQRGLSTKFISDYLEVMEGYSAVDQIIQNIEDIGGQLQDILDVWHKIGSASDGDDDNNNSNDKDTDAGTHLVEISSRNHNHIKGLDTSSEIYQDAMDGFLMQQPDIVNPEFDLKSYQITGLNWMLLLYRKGISGILADEMGLGKTAQVISFLGRLYELGETGPHMIVVPSSTLDNWMREFERFCPDLEVRCYYGSQNERQDQQEDIMDDREDIHAVVTTYAIATGRIEDRNFLRRLRCKSMILDEGHMLKNYTSARYSHLMRLNVPFRLLLTGTPLQNNLQELVSLLIFIMPDVFSGNEDDVRKIFKLKNYSGGKDSESASSSSTTNAAQMLSRQRIHRAKKMMTPFVLRRRKAHVLTHLPKKIHHVDYCPMTRTQNELYTQIVTDSQKRYKDVIMDDTDGTNNSTANSKNNNNKMEKFSNIVMQLRKAADHPLLFRRIYNDTKIKRMAKEIMRDERYWDSEEQYIYEDMGVMTDFELNRLCKDHKSIQHHMLTNEEWMDAGKVQHLKQLLPRMKQNGSKVLLFSQFTSMLDILEPVMKTLGLSFLRLDGSTKVGERQNIIDQFNQDESLDVFLLSTKAGGFGINLTSANVVVMYDMDFNPQNDKQAEDRAHRVGQTKDVTVHKLLSKQTIEQQILAMADIRLRLDRTISGVDGGDQQNKDGNGNDYGSGGDHSDDQGMDQVKMKSLLKSALLQS